MSRYCLIIDLDRCFGCHSCEVACKNANDVRLGCDWNKVLEMGPFGDYPNLSGYFLPKQCQQCENAPCIEVCPTGASQRDPETGAVIIDSEVCIGCQLCMTACPYGARTSNEVAGVVEKCTLCRDLTAAGEQPACVAACCGKARYYGDLDDPSSDAAMALAAAAPEALHKLPDTGNAPLTTYIMTDKYAAWVEDPLA